MIIIISSPLILYMQSAKADALEDVNNLNKMAIITTQTGQVAGLSHHQSLMAMPNPYIAPFGLLGLLVGSAIERAAVQSTLADYSDSLKNGLADFNPKTVLDETFARLFVMDFKTIDPLSAEKVMDREKGEKEGKERNYALLRDRLRVDSVLEVDFAHVLEVHGKTLAASVITAYVRLIRIEDNTIILKSKQISSGKIAKNWYRADELVSNNAQIYKTEFSRAAEAIVYLTALELGVNLGSTGKFYWQQERKTEEAR